MVDGRHFGNRYIAISKNYPISMKFCTQQQILNWMSVTWSKMKKLHWTDSEFDRTYFLFIIRCLAITCTTCSCNVLFIVDQKFDKQVGQQMGSTHWFDSKFNFYRATRMHSADYAVARCVSMCPSVRLSVCHTPVFCRNGWNIILSKFFHLQVARPF